MSRQCTISEPFRREHKRKRISELELRTDELQERLNTSSQRDTSALPEPTWTAVNSSDHQNVESESRLASVAPFFRDAAIAPVSFRSFSQAAETLQTPESLPHDQSPTGTLPRTLEGQTIDAKDIDALFQTYFRDYASLMPILEPSMTPNACYALSSFLFWAIIGVGCRTCHNNPTLLGVLPPKIHKMALLSVNGNGSLQTVQAWLLLLYWPFPKSNTGQDLIFPMSAAILHMAMQLGLHLPSSGQEFSKVRLRLSEEEMRMRAETWGYCTLIYQRSCVAKGMPATPILDIPYDLEQRRALFQNMSPRLKFELKLQDVVTRGSIAVSQNGLRVMSAEQERSLDTLLNVFQAQIAGVGLEYASDLDRLYVQLSTQSILAYNLYKSPAAQDPTSLYDLCMTCCQVIESFDHLDRIGQICLAASPIFFYHGLMVPCHILLRLLKTSFSRYITIERAKSALFLGIGLHKRMSLQNDDVPARSGVALTQLWNSTRVFRKPNGSETVALRIRSRLSGSIVLDGIVWWREEFGAFMGVYPPPITDARNDPPPNEHGIVPNGNALPEATMPAPAKPDYSNFLDDPMLTEFGWPVDDDIFSSIWTDNTLGKQSDDEENGNPYARRGADRIKLMLENSDKNRLASKKISNQIQKTGVECASIGSQALFHLWKNTWKSWITRQRKGTAGPPSAENICRFMDETLQETTPKGRGKPIPSQSLFVTGTYLLNRHLTAKHPDWRGGGHIALTTTSWLNKMVKEQRLWRGIYRKRQFVTLFVLRKLTIAWFTTALRQGTLGFDVSLGRVLPLILMMAIDCRVGDIVACDTQHAKAGMYTRHEDIYLTLDDEGDEVSNVVADVTMKYEKGKKLSHDNRCRRVEQFHDPAYNTVDFILLWIAHCLRHGFFAAGSNLTDVLAAAKARPDRQIQYKYPDYPVASQVNKFARGLLKKHTELAADVVTEILHLENPTDFIMYFARFNVVRNVTVSMKAGSSISASSYEGRVASGNSRDPPSQFMFICPDCPGKSFATQQNYQQHRESCLWRQIKAAEDAAAGVKKEKKRVEPPKDTACPHAGPGPDDCKAGPFKKSNLAAHLETHEFQEKSRCPRENCPSERVFPKLVDWRLHLLKEHKGQKELPEPVICELCNEVWTTAQAYNQHLKFKHSFKGKKLADAKVEIISKKAAKKAAQKQN
ncbi:hypothetical protein LTR20_007250 [Exophiala xenobiotica]|nr:hypothetical protein LTS13_006520 [Exophiala xenobiotica]KAK5401111.1 hypothetical protein LTR79_001630 [Exophiala xenobiotica]KAK5409039.1 hypothetical protein LTR90_009162 [Exophiala xenobiotica]KAK5459943.1 hypothetical protein LTR20_007250 [Exophiala xenobiotica]KAK5488880.1 hypothetical protein LTR26_004196 [Exophiala xenobiotica]